MEWTGKERLERKGGGAGVTQGAPVAKKAFNFFQIRLLLRCGRK